MSGGWKDTCLTRLAAWRNGLYHACDGGGETYEGSIPRCTPLWAVGTTWVNDDVEDAEEIDELEENTESLSEFELPVEVEGWENGRSSWLWAKRGAGRGATGGAVPGW